MNQSRPCEEITRKVLKCHRIHGKLGEDCVREELDQKKCFAELLCRREARQFYNEKSVPISTSWSLTMGSAPSGRVSCSTVVEVFAKPENDMIIPEGITKEDRKFCRKVTHELASCMAKKRKQ